MAVITTPYMGMILPSIITTRNIGTLPQDWALYINSNLMTFDNHDHAQLGAPISSVNLQVSENVDIENVNITQVNQLNFPDYTGVEVPPRSLFCHDSINLFYLADNGNLVTITTLGSLPSDVGGFYGDYVSAHANAAFDGPTNSFTFYGNNGDQNATIQFLNLTATNVSVTNSATMPSGMVLNAENVVLTDPNTNFVNSILVQQPNNSFTIANVVGDGSPYVNNPSGFNNNVPITDTDYIYNCNNSDSSGIAWTGNVNFNAGAINQEVITIVFQSANIKEIWNPGELATIALFRVAPVVNNPFSKPPTVNIVSAKVCVVSTANILTWSILGGLPLWWRCYVTKVTYPSSMTAYFQNTAPNQQTFLDTGQGVHYLRAVVKFMLTYKPDNFFGNTS